MSVTIRDVARKAGVSTITASRAFSGTHPVAEDTRRRVLRAADELGYEPDLLARGLVRRRCPVIGMVALELSNPFIAPIIDSVEAVAREREHQVIIKQSGRSRSIEEASLDRLRQLRVAGVLIAPVSPSLQHLESLKAKGTPVVVFARRWQKGDYVTGDDYAGGRLAAEHLVRLGHRKLGFVALGEQGNTAVQGRLEGFRVVLEEAGAYCAPTWSLFAERQTPEEGIRAADAFVALPDKPSAVFVTPDRIAIGFVHRLLERGMRVPDDVAVVGYDDIRYSEFLEVPLTTVALPTYEMGRQASEILFERIDGKGGDLRQVLLSPQLVVRASCGGHQPTDAGRCQRADQD